MINYNVSAVYFSPTDNSRKGACAIAGVFDKNYQKIDMTLWNSKPEKSSFDETDLVIFGAPVYSGRVFKGALERFSRLSGKQTPCILTVSYGNRHYDDALLELYDIAVGNGFLPFAAAALIGRHTYGEIEVGRPDETDISENADFAQKAYVKLHGVGPVLAAVPGNRPYREGGMGGRFRPLTDANCTHCGLCSRKCPEGAISLSNYYDIDDARCIACFRCIRICRVHAKNMDTDEYRAFAKMFTEKLSAKRSNEYFI